jgi:hypothetical protein
MGDHVKKYNRLCLDTTQQETFEQVLKFEETKFHLKGRNYVTLCSIGTRCIFCPFRFDHAQDFLSPSLVHTFFILLFLIFYYTQNQEGNITKFVETWQDPRA